MKSPFVRKLKPIKGKIHHRWGWHRNVYGVYQLNHEMLIPSGRILLHQGGVGVMLQGGVYVAEAPHATEYFDTLDEALAWVEEQMGFKAE